MNTEFGQINAIYIVKLKQSLIVQLEQMNALRCMFYLYVVINQSKQIRKYELMMK